MKKPLFIASPNARPTVSAPMIPLVDDRPIHQEVDGLGGHTNLQKRRNALIDDRPLPYSTPSAAVGSRATCPSLPLSGSTPLRARWCSILLGPHPGCLRRISQISASISGEI